MILARLNRTGVRTVLAHRRPIEVVVVVATHTCTHPNLRSCSDGERPDSTHARACEQSCARAGVKIRVRSTCTHHCQFVRARLLTHGHRYRRVRNNPSVAARVLARVRTLDTCGVCTCASILKTSALERELTRVRICAAHVLQACCPVRHNMDPYPEL